MRKDLKNFEITTAEINNCAGKDVYNISLSQEMRDQVWQQEYKKRLQSALEANGVKDWLVPLSLDIPSATKVDEYLDSLVEQTIDNSFLTLLGGLCSMLALVGHFFYRHDPLPFPFIIAAIVLIIFTIYKWERINNALKKKPQVEEIRGKIAKAKTDVVKKVNAYITQYEQEYNRKNSLSPTLTALLQEIKKYNQVVEELVYNINVIDQLEEVGEAVSIKDRDNVLGAFRGMRTDLIRALKVERILRENPRFKPELFSVNFAPLQDLELSQQVANCAQLVNDALQIGIRVQETMRNFVRDILRNPPPEPF